MGGTYAQKQMVHLVLTPMSNPQKQRGTLFHSVNEPYSFCGSTGLWAQKIDHNTNNCLDIFYSV